MVCIISDKHSERMSQEKKGKKKKNKKKNAIKCMCNFKFNLKNKTQQNEKKRNTGRCHKMHIQNIKYMLQPFTGKGRDLFFLLSIYFCDLKWAMWGPHTVHPLLWHMTAEHTTGGPATWSTLASLVLRLVSLLYKHRTREKNDKILLVIVMGCGKYRPFTHKKN